MNYQIDDIENMISKNACVLVYTWILGGTTEDFFAYGKGKRFELQRRRFADHKFRNDNLIDKTISYFRHFVKKKMQRA